MLPRPLRGLLGTLLVWAGLATPLLPATAAPAGRWTAERAAAWQERTGWLVGCNYCPAYAINPLEMWQADTFDAAALDRELAWAGSLGFNSLRVFLHDLAWRQDPRGFLRRMDTFLDLAERHRIGVMFVLFDAVWDPFPKAGPQRAPKPHVHNSGWIQSPGAEILGDPARHDELQPYVQDVVRHFRRDRRIHAWDLFNEPDNPNTSAYGKVELRNKAPMARMLLEKTFAWARAVRPSQPLTSGVWIGDWADPKRLSPM